MSSTTDTSINNSSSDAALVVKRAAPAGDANIKVTTSNTITSFCSRLLGLTTSNASGENSSNANSIDTDYRNIKLIRSKEKTTLGLNNMPPEILLIIGSFLSESDNDEDFVPFGLTNTTMYNIMKTLQPGKWFGYKYAVQHNNGNEFSRQEWDQNLGMYKIPGDFLGPKYRKQSSPPTFIARTFFWPADTVALHVKPSFIRREVFGEVFPHFNHEFEPMYNRKYYCEKEVDREFRWEDWYQNSSLPCPYNMGDDWYPIVMAQFRDVRGKPNSAGIEGSFLGMHSIKHTLELCGTEEKRKVDWYGRGVEVAYRCQYEHVWEVAQRSLFKHLCIVLWAAMRSAYGTIGKFVAHKLSIKDSQEMERAFEQVWDHYYGDSD